MDSVTGQNGPDRRVLVVQGKFLTEPTWNLLVGQIPGLFLDSQWVPEGTPGGGSYG